MVACMRVRPWQERADASKPRPAQTRVFKHKPSRLVLGGIEPTSDTYMGHAPRQGFAVLTPRLKPMLAVVVLTTDHS